MRQWFRVEEPDANPALVAGRPVRNIDPQEGLFVDEEGNSYRLAGGGQAKPDYAEVIPVEGGPGTRLEAGAAPMPIKQRGGNGLPDNGPATPQRRGEARRHCERSVFRAAEPARAESAREVRRGPSAARLCPEARAQRAA